VLTDAFLQRAREGTSAHRSSPAGCCYKNGTGTKHESWFGANFYNGIHIYKSLDEVHMHRSPRVHAVAAALRHTEECTTSCKRYWRN